jgi:transketolase
MKTSPELDKSCIDTLRMLAVDAVQKANSGHPGMPMGAAPMAYALWTQFLRHNPKDPAWPDRDRFVLSAGHGSMLLYSLLHLTGYDLPLDELVNFRQWGSATPGHPERGHTPGVEMTTGPLGQGLSTAVGMAVAEAHLAARYNRPGFEVVDHDTYVLCSDGDLMEGVASEAASLAGHLGLGRLIVLYDDNHITIEGGTDLAFTEDVAGRFKADGWQVQRGEDGNDPAAGARAIKKAKKETGKPSLIAVRTVIACGSPNKQGTSESHGAPLGEDEVRQTKRNLGWPEDKHFFIPDEALSLYRKAVPRGRREHKKWRELFALYGKEHPQLAAELARRTAGELPAGWEQALPDFSAEKPMASRVASGKSIAGLARALPELMGGSADLAPSNNTLIKGEGAFTRLDRLDRNLHFGVREHGMGAVLNGMALHGGFIPYGGTFLIFSDYMRPAIRLAAIQGLKVVYVFTHDSIGLGEDGPTHQPIEQLPALRAIPGLTVLRPADAVETAECWRLAVTLPGPVALILSRQNLAPLARREGSPSAVAGASRGAYVLDDGGNAPQGVIIASGSEVGLALAARDLLAKKGVAVRVVNMVSFEQFERQDAAYRESVLPRALKNRVAVEAASPFGWERYARCSGRVVGMARFGASAPAKVLFEKFGFTAGNVAKQVEELIAKK